MDHLRRSIAAVLWSLSPIIRRLEPFLFLSIKGLYLLGPRIKTAVPDGSAFSWQGQKEAAFASQNLPSCARLSRARTRTVHRTVLPSQGSIPSASAITKQTPLASVCYGRGRRDRTLGTRFWRPLLYQLSYTPVCNGGKGGIRTLAGLTTPNGLANRPLQPLEYFPE